MCGYVYPDTGYGSGLRPLPWRTPSPGASCIHRADTPSVRPDTKGQEPCQLKKKKEKAKKVLQLARALPIFSLVRFQPNPRGAAPRVKVESKTL